tara:strand:- start:1548 stop:1787 length:240 start_codon:yes stop_codon:yes gene_type:complete
MDFLLQFDAKCFLDVIQKLFAGQSYQFLDQQVLKNSEPKVVLMSIHKQVLKQADKKMGPGLSQSPIMNYYYSFILNIQV